MARKAKKSILASVMAPTVEETAGVVSSEDNEVKESSSNETLDNAIVEEKIELQEKPQYEDVSNLTDEIHKLLNENSDLKDKLASYIEELENVNSEYKKLKTDYDDVLVKISDVSFENALLKSKVEELEKSQNTEVNANSNLKPIEVRQSTSVPYIQQPKCNRNGYTDWN